MTWITLPVIRPDGTTELQGINMAIEVRRYWEADSEARPGQRCVVMLLADGESCLEVEGTALQVGAMLRNGSSQRLICVMGVSGRKHLLDYPATVSNAYEHGNGCRLIMNSGETVDVTTPMASIIEQLGIPMPLGWGHAP